MTIFWKTFGNFLQLLKILLIFGNYWQFFWKTFNNFEQLLTALEIFIDFWQLLTTFSSFWQLMKKFNSLCQFCASFSNFQQVLATYGKFADLYTDQLDRQAGRTSYLYRKPWLVCIFEDWHFSFHIVAASKSNGKLVWSLWLGIFAIINMKFGLRSFIPFTYL